VTVVYVAVLAPFLAAVVGFSLGRRRPSSIVLFGVGGIAVSLVSSLVLALRVADDADVPGRFGERGHIGTVPTGLLPFGLDLQVDGLAVLVALAVTVVALAVQVYSTAYMLGDPGYSSYTAFISLFTAAMLLVVFADDLFVLLVGWEVMGVCSYFLIGHHWELEDARRSAVKAFVVTRLGDVGFLFGIFVLGVGAGTFRISTIVGDAVGGRLSTHTVTIATLLLLCGVVGKSAQFPLHTWLPDAMAGPTPISALIHAATMVAAGIYLVARLYPVFLMAPTTLAVMAVIASVTMLGGALAALAQDDIKRVLAYSTVSQLAYMLGALAVGSATAASFHLLTHAAFKALLFLAAGSVIHAVGTNLMRDMGGLRRAMPVTFVTMTVGLAALAGLPPFSGFFSKEAVLGAAEDAARHDGPVASWAAWLVLVVGLLTVGVTAAYVTRLWLMTFFGAPRGRVAAHESSPAMSLPLVALAVPAALIGFVGIRGEWLSRWLNINQHRPGQGSSSEASNPLHIGTFTSTVSVVLTVLGFVVVLLVWRRAPAEDPMRVASLRPVFAHAFYVDDLYDRWFVRPVQLAAGAVRWTDNEVVIATVAGSGHGATRLAVLLRRTQQGNVQTYLTGLLAGVVILAVGVVTLT
jgi:NADH-quinone oxidoreductase subunit L